MNQQLVLIVSLLLISIFFIPQNTLAHCDSFEGSVVVATKKGLQNGNVNHVLLRGGVDDEEGIKNMFDKVM